MAHLCRVRGSVGAAADTDAIIEKQQEA